MKDEEREMDEDELVFNPDRDDLFILSLIVMINFGRRSILTLRTHVYDC